MTTPQHAVQSALIQYMIYPKWYMIFIAVILSIIPDVGRLFQKDPSDWTQFYEKSHSLTWYNLLIPYWNLHIMEDYYTHDHVKGGWLPWVIWVEIGLWVIEFMMIYTLFF